MKLTAKHNKQTFEIDEDLPGVGFNVYAYDSNGKNTHDYLQDTLEMAKKCALEEFGVPLDSWKIEQQVICCFCGDSLNFDSAVQISILVNKDENEAQALFSHKQCLDKVLHKSVVKL